MAKNKELEEFGRRVKEFRLQKRLSQQELADRVGYKGKDMISRIEPAGNRAFYALNPEKSRFLFS